MCPSLEPVSGPPCALRLGSPSPIRASDGGGHEGDDGDGRGDRQALLGDLILAELIYGFDPLCGWCYGLVPAMRRVEQDHPDLPIRLVMSGLVSEGGVGPYARMESYIRRAEVQLKKVTGRE